VFWVLGVIYGRAHISYNNILIIVVIKIDEDFPGDICMYDLYDSLEIFGLSRVQTNVHSHKKSETQNKTIYT